MTENGIETTPYKRLYDSQPVRWTELASWAKKNFGTPNRIRAELERLLALGRATAQFELPTIQASDLKHSNPWKYPGEVWWQLLDSRNGQILSNDGFNLPPPVFDYGLGESR